MRLRLCASCRILLLPVLLAACSGGSTGGGNDDDDDAAGGEAGDPGRRRRRKRHVVPGRLRGRRAGRRHRRHRFSFGWKYWHMQGAAIKMWIDDVVVDTKPIGCP